MKIKTNLLKTLLLVNLVLSSTLAAAAGDEKKDCRKPRIKSVTPPHLSEVQPESEFTFTLPVWTNPEKVTMTVKKIPTELSIENHNSFFLARGKIPPQLSATYARFSVRAEAELGCVKHDGWLYKIAERAEQNTPAQPEADISSAMPAGNAPGQPQ